MPTLSLRMGQSLHSSYLAYYQSLGRKMSKSQALQYLLAQYLADPQVYSRLTVRELREPMAYSVSMLVPEKLQQQVSDFADSRGLKVSEVLRFAIYQELIIHG